MKFIKDKRLISMLQISIQSFRNELNSNEAFLKQNFFFREYLKGSIKDGKKLFFFNNLSSISFDLLYCIKKTLPSYKYSYEVLSHQLAFPEYLNINFLLKWYTQPLFFFFFTNLWKPRKVKSKRKNKKQRQGKKYTAVRYFLKKKDRWRIMFRVFFLKLLNTSGNTLKLKLLKLFLDMILNYKKSWLYLFKLSFYKKILFI